jgi:HSP90 family molecular chaperone
LLIEDGNQANDDSLKENLIGQFGVGFYSAFIVADTVEVFSKKIGSSEVNVWVSDGSGEFEVAEAQESELGIEHGTKIIIHLNSEQHSFSEVQEVKKAVDKYSNFVQFPIKVDGELINTVQAIWSRSPSEVSAEEYLNFFEHVSATKENYKFKLHYAVEVPLNIKALLFVPAKNKESFAFADDQNKIDLYSKKILITKNCKDLLPNYLRFVKGVVDCEDLPLNISRENYQDTGLMMKLKSLLTKRVLRLLQEKAKRDPNEYKEFYTQFHMNIKEGLHTDHDNKKTLLSLIRFDSNIGEHISLDTYLENMKEGQDKIYFFYNQSKDMAENSAYMEPFLKYNIPVLYLSINIEEMILQQLGQYENKQFVNIESPQMTIPKNLITKNEVVSEFELPEQDRQNFCLWVRNELQPLVTNVVISEKLIDSAVMVSSMMSSGMRQMMSFMDQNMDMNQFNQNLVMEVNPEHEMIYKLNILRKTNIRAANSLIRHLLDNAMMNAGIPFDMKTFMNRMNLFIIKLTDFEIVDAPERSPLLETDSEAQTITESENNSEVNDVSESSESSDSSDSEMEKKEDGQLTEEDKILMDALKDFKLEDLDNDNKK